MEIAIICGIIVAACMGMIIYIHQEASKTKNGSQKRENEQNTYDNYDVSTNSDVSELFNNYIENGGNLTFIASNITTTYCVFRDTPFGKILNEEQLLCATALCNSLYYVSSGEISSDTIQRSVGYALTGTIGNFVYNVPHSGDFGFLSNFEDRTLFHVFGLSMQLEFLYFLVDTDFTSQELCDSLIDNKEIIESAVEKTYKNPKANPTYPNIHAVVSDMISNAEFRNLIKSYKFGR